MSEAGTYSDDFLLADERSGFASCATMALAEREPVTSARTDDDCPRLLRECNPSDYETAQTKAHFRIAIFEKQYAAVVWGWLKDRDESVEHANLDTRRDTLRERNRRAAQLVRGWLADESGYDERVWPTLRDSIETNRLSDRSRFNEPASDT